MEKTEKATPKHENKARRQGQKISLNSFEGLFSMCGYLVCILFVIRGFITDMPEFIKGCDLNGCIDYTVVYQFVLCAVFLCVLPLALTLMVSAVFNRGVVVRFNPIKGVNVLENVKYFSLAKLAPLLTMTSLSFVIISFFLFSMIVLFGIKFYVDNSLEFLLMYYLRLSLSLILTLLFLSFAVEYFLQKKIYNRQIRMSKYDVKKENEDDYGKPVIKSHIRKVRDELLSASDKSAIMGAQVAVCNPTHIFIALTFDEKVLPVPYVAICLTGGRAFQAKQFAEKQGKIVYKDITLARSILKCREEHGSVLLPAQFFPVFNLYRNKT